MGIALLVTNFYCIRFIAHWSIIWVLDSSILRTEATCSFETSGCLATRKVCRPAFCLRPISEPTAARLFGPSSLSDGSSDNLWTAHNVGPLISRSLGSAALVPPEGGGLRGKGRDSYHGAQNSWGPLIAGWNAWKGPLSCWGRTRPWGTCCLPLQNTGPCSSSKFSNFRTHAICTLFILETHLGSLWFQQTLGWYLQLHYDHFLSDPFQLITVNHP
jgi:hypothetical protein